MKKRITVIGGANVDIGGRPAAALALRDSNPGLVGLRFGGRIGYCLDIASRVEDRGPDPQEIFSILNCNPQLHQSLLGRHFGGCDIRAPYGNMGCVRPDQMHIAVEAGSRIPARRVREVL